eukprot:Hpha_TRINITY_DN20229_c0_g1::TRINITY_DN20229_c0_g1_i1::g.168202::m.168202
MGRLQAPPRVVRQLCGEGSRDALDSLVGTVGVLNYRHGVPDGTIFVQDVIVGEVRRVMCGHTPVRPGGQPLSDEVRAGAERVQPRGAPSPRGKVHRALGVSEGLGTSEGGVENRPHALVVVLVPGEVQVKPILGVQGLQVVAHFLDLATIAPAVLGPRILRLVALTVLVLPVCERVGGAVHRVVRPCDDPRHLVPVGERGLQVLLQPVQLRLPPHRLLVEVVHVEVQGDKVDKSDINTVEARGLARGVPSVHARSKGGCDADKCVDGARDVVGVGGAFLSVHLPVGHVHVTVGGVDVTVELVIA